MVCRPHLQSEDPFILTTQARAHRFNPDPGYTFYRDRRGIALSQRGGPGSEPGLQESELPRANASYRATSGHRTV